MNVGWWHHRFHIFTGVLVSTERNDRSWLMISELTNRNWPCRAWDIWWRSFSGSQSVGQPIDWGKAPCGVPCCHTSFATRVCSARSSSWKDKCNWQNSRRMKMSKRGQRSIGNDISERHHISNSRVYLKSAKAARSHIRQSSSQDLSDNQDGSGFSSCWN